MRMLAQSESGSAGGQLFPAVGPLRATFRFRLRWSLVRRDESGGPDVACTQILWRPTLRANKDSMS